jgi:hypothetical protein
MIKDVITPIAPLGQRSGHLNAKPGLQQNGMEIEAVDLRCYFSPTAMSFECHPGNSMASHGDGHGPGSIPNVG